MTDADKEFTSFLNERIDIDKDDWMKNRGVVGLVNLGNTCYFNSVIQCLVHTKPFLRLFMSNRFQIYLNPIREMESLAYHLNEVCRGLWYDKNQTKTFTPTHLHNEVLTCSMNNNKFNKDKQEDAYEFLVFLIDNLHEAMSRDVWAYLETKDDTIDSNELKTMNQLFSTKWSPLRDIFDIQKCVAELLKPKDPLLNADNDVYEYKYESMHTLLLSTFDDETVNKTFTKLEDCMSNYFKKINTFTTTFIKSPPVLIITLNRSIHMNKILSKLTHNITFPIDDELDMKDYMSSTITSECKYKLYAILNHSGDSMANGHNYSYVKHPGTQKWYTYNDKSAQEMTEETLKEIKGNGSADAYVLFYERV